jgi:16S rRNA (guanine527-N7)-methyltransferase
VFSEALTARLAGIVELSPEQERLLEAHYRLLVAWNRTLNLSAIRGLEESVERHYCESLFLGAHLPAGPLAIADIGSGPGFPGFPVAVLRPECLVTLIESHQRKAVFLREASRGLPGVRVLAKRAEDVRETFDVAISRAVSYKDLGGTLKALARNADLLSGAEEPPARMGFEWKRRVPLPWGKARFLWMGTAALVR